MKKEYIKPSMEVINIQATTMLATSMYDEEVNTDECQFGREDNNAGRPSNPNLWEQSW